MNNQTFKILFQEVSHKGFICLNATNNEWMLCLVLGDNLNKATTFICLRDLWFGFSVKGKVCRFCDSIVPPSTLVMFN